MSDEPLNFQVIVYRAEYATTFDGKQEWKQSSPQEQRFFFTSIFRLADWLMLQTFADHEVYYVTPFADTEEEHRNRGSKKDSPDRVWPERETEVVALSDGISPAGVSLSFIMEWIQRIENEERVGILELMQRVKKLEEKR